MIKFTVWLSGVVILFWACSHFDLWRGLAIALFAVSALLWTFGGMLVLMGAAIRKGSALRVAPDASDVLRVMQAARKSQVRTAESAK